MGISFAALLILTQDIIPTCSPFQIAEGGALATRVGISMISGRAISIEAFDFLRHTGNQNSRFFLCFGIPTLTMRQV